jgi:Arc/MetJ family transcription regulator
MCTLAAVRTNIEIDDDLLAEARAVAGTRTKRETVQLALTELVRRRARREMLDLRGKVHWDGDLDEVRRGRTA